MKGKRNKLLRAIRDRLRDLRMEALKEKVSAVEGCKDSAKTFQAIREVKDFGKKKEKLIVNNDQGERIMDDVETAEYVRTYFVSQFSDVSRSPLEAHAPTISPQPLEKPIESSEVNAAIRKLKKRRAIGLDNLCAELLKHGPPELSDILADIYNKAMARGEDLGLGLGKLVTLPKPGKPAGPVKNIRPIVLLPLLRKLLSLIILERIRQPVDAFLSPAHSGFRSGRSCTDVVWAHRWLVAKTLRYKEVVNILGIDMSRRRSFRPRSKKNAAQSHWTDLEAQSYE